MTSPITQLAHDIQSGLFATPATIEDALDQAADIAKASGNTMAVMTAVQVVVNAIAAQLIKIDQENSNG